MSLPKPTFEKLIEAIDDLDNRGDGIACCRNCYSVTSDYVCCEKCGLWRCDECCPTHLDMRDHLALYLCLELEVGYSILESLLHAYHVDVLICAECGTSSCTRCGVMHFTSQGKTYRSYTGVEKTCIYYKCDECYSK